MEKFVQKLAENIKLKKYSKILYILTDMKNNGEFVDIKTNMALIEQKEILKLIILNDLQSTIRFKKELIPDMIAIVKYLDIEFQEEIEKIVLNYLIEVHENIFREKIIVINSINEAIKLLSWYEFYKKELEINYLYMPDFWCVIDAITMKFCEMLDKCAGNMIDSFKNNPEKSVEVINYIVKFELKNTSQVICRKGCANKESKTSLKEKEELLFSDISKVEKNQSDNSIQIAQPFNNNLNSNDLQCKCHNKKILSKRFEMYYSFYVEELCKKLKGLFFNKEETEMQIITCFVHFFNELSKIYYRIKYFENEEMFTQFGLKCDNYLSYYISLIEVSDDFKTGILMANTLIFIEETMNEFLFKLKYFKNKNNQQLKSFVKLRELERKQFILLDKEIDKKLKSLNLNLMTNFSELLYSFLEREIFHPNFDQLTKEMSNFILSSFFSALLLIISKYKLNVERSEHMLANLMEIKQMISDKSKKIPFIDVIEAYLKIFLIPSNDVESFISNFLLVSNDRFDFSQILKKLADKSNNGKLYIEYKLQTNKKKQS
ncbi:hypothetical protein H312_02823 [Anncaliia algerae PRA339]|uniref:Uncharacterized protein n=1 Tax=Anncaliia algerae PRA339 TaxID=1288291 RepID=A0A059EYJ3_9MICR|nr:hypothetical protein H312_02823 [Anncaliia algerae PRA339]